MTKFDGGYIRNALKAGMVMQEQKGFNPFTAAKELGGERKLTDPFTELARLRKELKVPEQDGDTP